jgi:hypothetical protein
MRGFRPLVASILVLAGCTKLAGIDDDYTLGQPDASSGGVQNGGTSGSGVGGGTGGNGGSTSGGGSAGTPSGGAAGTSSCPVLAPAGTFPTPGIGVLDSFDTDLSSWQGDTDEFSVVAGELTLTDIQSSEIYFDTSFCPDQEVYAKAVTMDSNMDHWILNLKAQDFSGCDQLEVGYEVAINELWIASCEADIWTTHATKSNVLVNPGDVLGARARADGTVEVYLNGNLEMSSGATGFRRYALGGYIGLEIDDPVGSQRWDDFGGGP